MACWVFCDRLHQIVALARQEGVALLAFLEFLERHHVDRTHGFQALLSSPR